MIRIVRQIGKPRVFKDQNGQWVEAKEKIFIPEWGVDIPTAPYDNHSIYETGLTAPGTLPYMCTCGSNAVIVGFNVYKGQASKQGALFVCHSHASTGKHADGSG